MLTYAAAADLTDPQWGMILTEAEAAPLLRAASGIVRHATRAALYDVDGAGKPSDPDVIEAFRDATCAQVAFWRSARIDPAAGGMDKPSPTVASKSMGDRSVTYNDPSTATAVIQARSAAAQDICMDAWRILRDAGLI